jgi:hypothetical protein
MHDYNSTQAGRFDPALQECSPCNPGNYIIDPMHGPCVKCPEGADCPDGAQVFKFLDVFMIFQWHCICSIVVVQCHCSHILLFDIFALQFNPKIEGSLWKKEVTSDGVHTLRIVACPPGFALLRKENNPQADQCQRCPGAFTHFPMVSQIYSTLTFRSVFAGTSDYGYSLQEARWTGNENETGLAFFCSPCPKPESSVTCLGGTEVFAQQKWWLVRQTEENSTSRREFAETKHVFVAYQCDPEVCLENNTCANGRAGAHIT